ncbi:MAG: permease-like cell division protein FtsX [gamma proteobacterium symbiont of Bathyaustriella thionipta]|nr:permease-like cell division protein FtsX [gamma proteobacterium symbiont of Bathyaustriella thionipta]MCU7949499.1 permease-like cell division protein FtsX [gamma proteobacterium symbiont of Bathyaustriella thionipta]MCU7953236.1 permease-like cell division protein FtsX [gamma proteobacterium symbiont of Bathyaustriella thionipta]MCU7956085.1 permease-like cell division protein FtsX [gamma proteobacterium symbiont of Bathyaustriella thionipta]
MVSNNSSTHENTGGSVQLRQLRPSFSSRFKEFFIRHLQVFFYSLGLLSRSPFATLMTASALGIALALPAGLYVILDHARQLSGDMNSINQISLFMKKETAAKRIEVIQKKLETYPEVAQVKHINRTAALKEFKDNSGFGNALKALKTNPLPDLLVVYPSLTHSDPQQINTLLIDLKKIKEVDLVQLDIQWLQRLYAIINIGQRGVLIIGSLLALAVLLIIGNTIRLAIENRRSEIVVMKLIGGTDSFIRRPFLYTGFWYGLLGSLIAVLLVNISLIIINDPLTHLSSLYENNLFSLGLMGINVSITLLLSGCLLGLFGARIAVGKHLKEIEPK